MALSARKAQTAGPGRWSDGRGLILSVKDSGRRSWLFRYTFDGRRREIGIGAFPDVPLADAREKAADLRRIVSAGRDPLQERDRPRGLTFREAAEQLIEHKRPGWQNAKHAAQWSSTLATYVYPRLGDRSVDAVTAHDVLEVLRPIWPTKPETASRVRQRIEAVIDYATTIGARSGENPARWRGHLANLLPKPTSIRHVRHHAAPDWREAPALYAAILSARGIAARALAFTMLTAARSGEVRGMTWGEVDLDSGLWIVPAERIKAKREHRIPLVPEALALLGEPREPGKLVFESSVKPGRPLSDMTLAAVLKRMDRGDLTVHGFRSTFRDWAGETTAHPREVIEHALAHQLKDKAEAAYARGDLLRKRRALMGDWAAYLTSGELVGAT